MGTVLIQVIGCRLYRHEAGGNNNAEGLSSAGRRRDAAAFGAVVGAAGLDIREFLGAATWPLHDHAVDAVALPDAEGDWQLRLRKVTGSALHQPRLRRAAVRDPDRRADAVAIGGGPDQPDAQAAIAGL